MKKKEYEKQLWELQLELTRLNCIAHFLSQIPYERMDRDGIELPERSKDSEYDDRAPMKTRNYVPERY